MWASFRGHSHFALTEQNFDSTPICPYCGFRPSVETGGVNLDNMNDYLSLPVVSNIGASWLATKQQIADKQWDIITQQVKDALAMVKGVEE